MSRRRVIAPIASLVCTVDSTRWPVRLACTAICAVSTSRISPTITTSGSWRRIARRPAAKLIPTLALTGVWPMPSMAYSTGSSTVRMLRWPSLRAASAAYSVVVLPEPVGPVTSTMPLGWASAPCSLAATVGDSPSCASSRVPACLASRRSTTRSPSRAGRVDTRTSSAWLPIRSEIRPSCGTRFSAMSSRAITLIRDTSSGASRGGRLAAVRSTPSTRRRTRSIDSNGSTWMSEAPWRAPSAISPLIRRITGASSAAASRSAAAGRSSSSASRPLPASSASTLSSPPSTLSAYTRASCWSNSSAGSGCNCSAHPATRRSSASAGACACGCSHTVTPSPASSGPASSRPWRRAKAYGRRPGRLIAAYPQRRQRGPAAAAGRCAGSRAPVHPAPPRRHAAGRAGPAGHRASSQSAAR